MSDESVEVEATYLRLKEFIGRQDLADVSALLECKSYDEIPFDVGHEEILTGLPYSTQNRLLIRVATDTLNSILDDLRRRYPVELRSIYPMIVVTDWQQFIDGRLQDVEGETGLLVTALWCGNFTNPILGSFQPTLPAEPSHQLRFVAECLGEKRDDYELYEDVNSRYGQSFVERVYIRSRRVQPPWHASLEVSDSLD